MSEATAEQKADPKKKSWLATLIRWIGIAVVAIVFLIVASFAIAMMIESRAMNSDREANPPMGQMVSVGDYELHAIVEGEGSPTVVFEAGFGNWAAGWANIYPEIAKRTKVVVYDRAGLGWSDPAPTPRTTDAVIADLHALLQALDAQPPYILVGHSMGGLLNRTYQKRYPDEVAGLVLVDAAHEEQNDRFPAEFNEAAEATGVMFKIAPFLSRIGALRFAASKDLLEPQLAPYRQLPEAAQSAAVLFVTSPDGYAAAEGEFGLIDEAKQFISCDPGSLGDLPVAVVSAGIAEPLLPETYEEANTQARETWIELQAEQAALSTNSRHTTAENSGHMIPMYEPEAVIEAIMWTLDNADVDGTAKPQED